MEPAGAALRLHLAVRDSGMGIPADRMDRLFQPFSQVDPSMSRRYGGTGLGLIISKRLAQLMGGDIWVESKVGEGSVFHCTAVVAAAPDAATEPLPPFLQGKCIWVADSHPVTLRNVTRLLQRWGAHTRSLDSAQALTVLLQQAERIPDALLLDVRFLSTAPDLGAIWRAADRFRTCPLIAVAKVGDRASWSGPLHTADYLLRPIKQQQLQHVLERVLLANGDGLPRGGSTSLNVFVEAPPSPPLRILLAEDNLINQKVVLRMLEKLGYTADVAGNGLEALDALHRQPYDLVLMDLHMPDLDGIAATQMIRLTMPADRQPRIVALTAAVMVEDQNACLAAGMDSFLTKPVRPEHLAHTLRTTKAL